MKKFLTAILALVVVASVASVAAFAADGPTVVVKDVEVPVGTTEVTVEVWATNLPEGGIMAVGATVDGDDALTATAVASGDAKNPLNLWGPLSATGEMNIMLAVTAPISEDSLMGTITYTIPDGATAGTEYVVDVVKFDADNTFDAAGAAIEFALQSGKVIVVEPATETEPATDVPATDAPATDAPATDAPATDAPATDAPATDAPATDAPATDAPATDAPATDAPATDAPEAPNTDKAPATGDMVFVVLAVMVVALGAAIVVKKVNVK